MFSSSFKYLYSLGLLTLQAPFSADNPVCIIGAGPSGLTVAHELEARGRSTVIFDENAAVGGKCRSYYDDTTTPPTYHPLGAFLLTNQTYSNTLPLILEAGLPLSPALSPGPSANWNYWQYSYGDQGVTNLAPIPLPTPAEAFTIINEVMRYTTLWDTRFAPFSGPSYKGDIPHNFTVSTQQWLSDNGFLAIPQFVEMGLVYAGYGHITETPALYALQILTPEILTYYIGATPGYSVVPCPYYIDFQSLWDWYSKKYVKGTIHLNATVTTIDRSKNSPIVTYKVESSAPTTQACSSLVMAFPPTPRALKAAGLDFTNEETSVFANVGVTAYWAAAFQMELPYPYVFLETPATSDYQPITMFRDFNNSKISTAYSLGPSPYNETASKSDEDVKELLVSNANVLGEGLAQEKAGGVESYPTVVDADIKVFLRQDHFPHVPTNALQDGFYAKYNALQGKKNTFWTSGLNRFENVESTIRSAKNLVENVMF
ncbi:hypothetical protein GYMLUDRAFT_172648 [Collybiopsis luxurians FD-317 M1]|uniref:Amine oxidase domain-containing protein n=1 Tax=Collybiopsis luxurians FD-317 M1 TaxID=944289 RepID=A0A0D0BQP9_9AGAR|nr:hypothetical protein GYMLUDRAFT_172648 [Collybiopsis luxurians FD-317 M1]